MKKFISPSFWFPSVAASEKHTVICFISKIRKLLVKAKLSIFHLKSIDFVYKNVVKHLIGLYLIWLYRSVSCSMIVNYNHTKTQISKYLYDLGNPSRFLLINSAIASNVVKFNMFLQLWVKCWSIPCLREVDLCKLTYTSWLM